MAINKTEIVLTPEQQQRLSFARKGLARSVKECKQMSIVDEDSSLICRAQQGINSLSLAEALWLNQKKWSPMEKTCILWHVDNERNKKRHQSVSLYDITIASGLALTTLAAHLKGYPHITAMLAAITVAKASCMAIDLVKDRTIDKMYDNHINELKQTNDNVRTGIHCLTPRATYMK